MLKIIVPATDGFDDSIQEFVKVGSDVTLELEHSLSALSKWEAKWETPFLVKEEHTVEETLDYIACMSYVEVPKDVISRLTNDNITEINKYIAAKMTATWIAETRNQRPSTEIVTTELIYYWMVALQIPFETQNWHINRLLMLIQVCNEKNKAAEDKKPTKPTRNDLAARRRLNAQRKKEFQTRG